MRKINLDPEIANGMKVERAGGRHVPTHSESRSNETGVSIERDAEVFRQNLSFLLDHVGGTQAAVAERAKVSHDWLRQLSKRGLTQIREKNREPLDRLRQLFGLDSVDELWSATLIEELKTTHRRIAAISPYLRSKDWGYARKVLTLLQTGDHDYLRGLIDSLYEHIEIEGVTERGYHMPDS